MTDWLTDYETKRDALIEAGAYDPAHEKSHRSEDLFSHYGTLSTELAGGPPIFKNRGGTLPFLLPGTLDFSKKGSGTLRFSRLGCIMGSKMTPSPFLTVTKNDTKLRENDSSRHNIAFHDTFAQ